VYSEGARLTGALVLPVLKVGVEALVFGRTGAGYVGDVFRAGAVYPGEVFFTAYGFRLEPGGYLYEWDETPFNPDVFRMGLTATGLPPEVPATGVDTLFPPGLPWYPPAWDGW
jgi:hypothetical protein